MGLLCLAISLYLLVLFGRILMSWFPPTPGTAYARVFEFFNSVTEPVLAPIRGMLPPVRLGGAGLDLSPLIVLIVAQLLLTALGCGGLFG
jgi:YggT family protein